MLKENENEIDHEIHDSGLVQDQVAIERSSASFIKVGVF